MTAFHPGQEVAVQLLGLRTKREAGQLLDDALHEAKRRAA